MRALLILTVLSFAQLAWADDVSLELRSKALPGESPALILKVNKAIANARLELRAEGGRVAKDLGSAKKGGELRAELPHPKPGKLAWRGSLDVSFVDGSTGSMPLNFETERVTTFRFQVLTSSDEIREQNRVAISMDRPCSKVEVEVYGDDGVVMANESKKFDNAPPGTRLEVEWLPKFSGPPLHVRVRAFDPDNVFSTVDSFPYFIEVEHDEVEFESGKSDVREVEVPKLQAALAPVNDAIRRYRKAVELSGREISLFIMGHTDTVGSASFNQALSMRRARSIAEWFHKAGIVTAIYVRGFGESMPKVDTSNDVDEMRNRRVDYRIAADSPTGSLSGWTRIKGASAP